MKKIAIEQKMTFVILKQKKDFSKLFKQLKHYLKPRRVPLE